MIVNAENHEYFPAEIVFELPKTVLHSGGDGIISKAGIGGHGLDLNAEGAFADFANIINIASVVQFRINIFEHHLRKCSDKFRVNDLSSLNTVIVCWHHPRIIHN